MFCWLARWLGFISQQPVNTALVEFAEQADLTLVFPDELVQGKSANEVIGRFTREKGVAVLLTGTGLTPKLSKNIVLRITCKVMVDF